MTAKNGLSKYSNNCNFKLTEVDDTGSPMMGLLLYNISTDQMGFVKLMTF